MSPVADGVMAERRLERTAQPQPPWRMPTRAALALRERGPARVRRTCDSRPGCPAAAGAGCGTMVQATTFVVNGDQVEAQMRLTPGVEVFDRVLAAIDANGDGVICEAEQQAYAEHLSRDLSLKIDGYPLQVRLVSSTFPKLEEMKEGLGDILLNFQADLPQGGLNRRLTFENHHLNAISVYLVNCLVPRDPNIHVTAQERNYNQSIYQLDYSQTGVRLPHPPSGPWSRLVGWLDQTGSGSLFKAFFYHGIHHILTGYDHLLFISALVLAATTFWNLDKSCHGLYDCSHHHLVAGGL